MNITSPAPRLRTRGRQAIVKLAGVSVFVYNNCMPTEYQWNDFPEMSYVSIAGDSPTCVCSDIPILVKLSTCGHWVSESPVKRSYATREEAKIGMVKEILGLRLKELMAVDAFAVSNQIETFGEYRLKYWLYRGWSKDRSLIYGARSDGQYFYASSDPLSTESIESISAKKLDTFKHCECTIRFGPEIGIEKFGEEAKMAIHVVCDLHEAKGWGDAGLFARQDIPIAEQMMASARAIMIDDSKHRIDSWKPALVLYRSRIPYL